MIPKLLHFFPFLVLLSTSFSVARTISSRSADGDKFDLYAYGVRMPGLSIFYADGQAVITDFVTANASEKLIPVTFSLVHSTRHRLGFGFLAVQNHSAPVNNKATRSHAFTNATWFVGAPDSSSAHRVGFLPDNTQPTQEVRTDGFDIRSRTPLLIEDNGNVFGAVYCAFATATAGVFSLGWNVTTETGGTPVFFAMNPEQPHATPMEPNGARCKPQYLNPSSG